MLNPHPGYYILIIAIVFIYTFLTKKLKKTYQELVALEKLRYEKLERTLIRTQTRHNKASLKVFELMTELKDVRGRHERSTAHIKDLTLAYNDDARILSNYRKDAQLREMHDLEFNRLQRDVTTCRTTLAIVGANNKSAIDDHNLRTLKAMYEYTVDRYFAGLEGEYLIQLERKKEDPTLQVTGKREFNKIVKVSKEAAKHLLNKTTIIESIMNDINDASYDYARDRECYFATGGPEPKVKMDEDLLYGEAFRPYIDEIVKKHYEEGPQIKAIADGLIGTFTTPLANIRLTFEKHLVDEAISATGYVLFDFNNQYTLTIPMSSIFWMENREKGKAFKV